MYISQIWPLQWLTDIFPLLCLDNADQHLEEMQFDLSFLPFEEIDLTILFVHLVLYYSSNDNVCS